MKWPWTKPAAPVTPMPVPPALVSLMPDVGYERWDWAEDIEPLVRWRLEGAIRALADEMNPDRKCVLQGWVQALGWVLSARDLALWQQQERARNERKVHA